MFAQARCGSVRSYIQSGNVIFSAPESVAAKLGDAISKQIQDRFGYRTPVILRTRDEIGEILMANPFLLAGHPEESLHVYFLAEMPKATSIRTLDPRRSSPDEFLIRGREVFLHMPNGMGRTKLTNAYFDKQLSMTSTARNWRTVTKLFELMAAL